MENKNCTVTIEVEKSPQAIFRCLTIDVSKWWGGADLKGNSQKLNDEFVIDHGPPHYSKQKLIEVVPGKRIVWLVTESTLNWIRDKHEWKNTKMIFDIIDKGDKTILHFTHEGLVPEKECYARCNEGWNMIIKERFFNLITTGKAI